MVEASLRATLPRGSSLAGVLDHMLLTAACGLALRSVIEAERTFEQLREAQRLMRRVVEIDREAEQPPAPSMH